MPRTNSVFRPWTAKEASEILSATKEGVSYSVLASKYQTTKNAIAGLVFRSRYKRRRTH